MTYQVGDEPVPGYRLAAFVGRGNSGDVWKALGPGRVAVALKIIPLDSKLGRRERKAILGLRNFNDNALVNIYGLWFKDRAGNILEYSEELDEDTANVPQRSVPGSTTGTVKRSSSSNTVAATRSPGIGRPPIAPAPGYLGHTIDPDALDLPPDEPLAAETASAGIADTNELARSEPHETERKASGTASGTDGDAADPSKASSKNATELVVAMTLGDMTLGHRLEQCTAAGETGIPLKELQRLMRDASRGIDYLNSRHFQHCDIKPENILIVGNGAKICDFGLARPTKIDPTTTLSPNGFTWACAAPEQLKRDRDTLNFSDHTDQYSLATSYYYLRTGRFPFDENSLNDLIERKTQGKLDLSSPILSKRERVALQKALALEPAARYPTAADFVEAMERATAPTASSPWRTFGIGAMAALLLACLAIGGWLAYQELAPSQNFTSLQQSLESGDYASAVASFNQLTRERERHRAEDALLSRLQARQTALASDQCAELDQLLLDGAAVVAALEGPARERAQKLLSQLEERRSQVIPAAVRSQLASYLNKREFAQAEAWRQTELPTQSACDQAVQAFVRDAIWQQWLTASASDAVGERSEQVLIDWPQLAKQVQAVGRADDLERVNQIRVAALRNTRERATTLLSGDKDAGWQASLPLWRVLAEQGDATTVEGRDDTLAWLVAEWFAASGRLPIDSTSEQLKKLAVSHPAEHPARWLLLDASVAHAQSRERSAINAATLERLISLLLALRDQSPVESGRPLTAWEQQQRDEMIASLDALVARLPAQEQPSVLAKLEQLRAGAAVNLRIAQIRQLLLKKELTTAREQIAAATNELTDPASRAKLAELTSCANLLDDQLYLPNILPAILDYFVTPAGAISAAELAQAINARAISYGEDKAEYDYAVQLYNSTRTQAPGNAALEQAYRELLERRLIAKLRQAKDYEIILADATALLQLSAATKSSHALLPLPVVAAAWIEATLAAGKDPHNDALAKQLDVLALAKRPLTAAERQPKEPWATYPAWVELVALTAADKPVDSAAVQSLYKGLAEQDFLQAAARRVQTAQRVQQSMPVAALPSDLEIPWKANNDVVQTAHEALHFVQQLAKDAPLDDRAQARLQAALAIVDYYRQTNRQESPTKALELSSTVLDNNKAAEWLKADGSWPSLFKHLQYVRARAALATLKEPPQDAVMRAELLQQAAAVVATTFAFASDQHVTTTESQEAADNELYFSLIQPALRLANANPDETQRPALATLHAAQARIVERSSSVRDKLLREPGSTQQTLFELTRDSYSQASQWEAKPALIARNSLPEALVLLDWYGERSSEYHSALPAIVARCASAAPDWHGTLYLQGLQHLYASRTFGRDLCNIAQSATSQKKELEQADQALQKAIASPTLTAEQRSEYLPRYYASASAVQRERALLRAKAEEKLPLLIAAREQATQATAAANEHPRKRFLEQAYLAEGHAYEDLALAGGRPQHFSDSEQSFKNAQVAAGDGALAAEAALHLGRCQLRNALRTIQRQDAEKLLPKLAAAEASLLVARDNSPKLGRPYLLGYASEADVQLAGVYMELAEFYAGRKEFERAFPYVAKADEAYLAAVAGAAKSAPDSWSDYQATWLRRAQKRWRTQRQQAAADPKSTRDLVARLANELLTAASTGKYPVPAEHRALALQSLLDLQETKTTAPILAELRAGRVPRSLTATQIAETLAVLEAKQKIVQAQLGVFGSESCDDLTMASLGVLLDLLQQSSRLPQFASVRDYSSQAVEAVAARLPQGDWKQAYAKAITIGYHGLAGVAPLQATAPRQRQSKSTDYQSAVKNLLQAIEQLQLLAQKNPAVVEHGLFDEEESTDAFRLALAELTIEVASFVPKTSLNAATKQLLNQAKHTLQQSLGRAALTRHQPAFEQALTQLDSFLE